MNLSGRESILVFISAFAMFSVAAYGCSPTRTVTKSLSNATMFQGSSSGCSPSLTTDRAKSGSMSPGILLSERDHRLARRIATIKIYMLLSALIGVPLAAFMCAFVEVRRKSM
jgi:hypothetical protein